MLFYSGFYQQNNAFLYLPDDDDDCGRTSDLVANVIFADWFVRRHTNVAAISPCLIGDQQGNGDGGPVKMAVMRLSRNYYFFF